jgi:hypothetical protein
MAGTTADKASEQALGLAEIRIRQLGEQLASCEKALAERDARVLVLTRDAGRLATSSRELNNFRASSPLRTPSWLPLR